MHANTGVCHFESQLPGAGEPLNGSEPISIPEPPPALHARDDGKADSLFDQLMQEAQPRRAPVSTNPYFVLGRLTRETVGMLIDGLAGLRAHVFGAIKTIDKAWQIGPAGVRAQAPESMVSEGDAKPADAPAMHWKLDALTPDAFWACAKAEGMDRDGFRGKLVVLIEPARGIRDATRLAYHLRWNPNDPVLERDDEQVLHGHESSVEAGKRDRQTSRLLEALKESTGIFGSFIRGDPAWEQIWKQASAAIRKVSLPSLMVAFTENIETINRMLQTREIAQADAQRLQAARQMVIRAMEALASLDSGKPFDLPAPAWKYLEALKLARARAVRTDFLVLEPEAGRRFLAKNSDKDVVIVSLAGEDLSRQARPVPELGNMRIMKPVLEADQSRHAGAEIETAESASSQRCDAAGDCVQAPGRRWEFEALTVDAFLARASAQGLDKDWFRGKAIVFIEPDHDSTEAMKMAARLRWKKDDPMLIMLDSATLEGIKRMGFEICSSKDSVPGKDCIGIADPAIGKKRVEQVTRMAEALDTGIRTLTRVLPQDEAWKQRHGTVNRYSVSALAALFNSQVEAVNRMLETHTIRQEDADLLQQVRSDIIREEDALDLVNRETFPGLVEYAWEQLRRHRAARAGSDRTDLIVLGTDVGRRFIAENRDEDVVIVTLRGGQQDQPEAPLQPTSIPSFGKMRIS